MLKKKIKMRIALILCVALMAGIVDLPGNCPASGAAQLSGTAQGEVQEFETPPGGLETVEVHHVTDFEAVQRIPSYETAASVFSLRSQTVFDSGTGAYGYQHLDAAQQEFYEAAEVSLKNFRADAEAEFIEIQGKYTPFRVSYDRNTLTDEKMIEAWMAFRADHPWLFWFSNVFGCGSQGSTGFFIPYVGDSYKQGPETLKAMEQTITDGVQKYLDAAGQADSKYEKVRIIYNEIINDINYAYKDGSKTPEDSDWAHSIVGVFDASYKKAVCEGYAKAFCFILNILDIPNVYVTGDAGGGHAWNAVSFDGGNTYYYMDSTWDDQGGSANSTVENTYRYFAMPKDAFEKKHTPDKGGTGVNWQYDLPVMGNNMDYTYYVRYHCYGTSDTICDQSSAEEFLKAAKVLSPQENCLLLLEDTSMLTTVVKALGVTESISYLSLSEYDMILYTTAAENFTSKTPATAIAFSDETVCVDVEPGESKVQTLLIGAVTADSDDYITFYSTDEDRVVVKTPYVKAREGECVEVVVKDSSAPVTIFAKSAAGGAKASCTITANKEPEPTTTPTAEPTATPTAEPTATPTATPTAEPTATPTAKPTATPTAKPTATPTAKPTATPTAKPTATPTAKPTVKPTATPTAKPTSEPTEAPIIGPTIKPTSEPIVEPTEAPIIGPTIKPTSEPTVEPTEAPIIGPTIKPTSEPTVEPTEAPIIGPTIKPTAKPTATPTAKPTATPTVEPTEAPTIKPTSEPIVEPTEAPIIGPTIKPTSEPIVEPTETPTVEPTTAPIIGPTIKPTSEPIVEPTETPTVEPTTAPIIGPTVKPTSEPIVEPTEAPTVEPTTAPIIGPTIKPTSEPIVEPTEAPIIGPTIRPTEAPTVEPTTAPIIGPTIKPGEGVPVVPEPTSAVVTEPSVSFNPVPVASSKPVLPDGGEDDEDEYDEYDEDEDKHDIEKGDEIKVGSLKYRVTKIKGTKGELAVVGVKSKNITSIVIPKKVSKEGISFTVTSIYKNAFKGCRKVKLLTIKSKDITNIAKKAFAGLSKKVKIKIPKAKSKVYKKLIKRAGFKLK